MKREEIRDMVIYLLKGKYVEDDEVIDSYTDSIWEPIQQLQAKVEELKRQKQTYKSEADYLRHLCYEEGILDNPNQP